MGTRSLTYIYDSNNKVLCVLYVQFDGYLDGYGADLAQFLLTYSSNNMNVFRVDMGHLATKLICHVSDKFGYAGLIDPTSPYYHCEEWEYHIYDDKIKIVEVGNKEREVTWNTSEFTELCEKGMDYENDENDE